MHFVKNNRNPIKCSSLSIILQNNSNLFDPKWWGSYFTFPMIKKSLKDLILNDLSFQDKPFQKKVFIDLFTFKFNNK